MINRDFSKSGKQYIKQNKIVLITLAIILLLGIIMLCVFGFKGGPDVKGYNTFSITVGSEYQADKLGDYTDDINLCLSNHDAQLYSVQVAGEGSTTTLVVKYDGKIKNTTLFNAELSDEMVVSVSNFSEHSKVGASLTSKDYIYAFACGLIIVTLAVIYSACRYNLACAITALGSSIFGVGLLMALTAIFRLTINSSFLAINIITLLLILGECFMIFDSLEKERNKLKDKNDRSTQLANTLKSNAFRQKFMYGAIFALALIFIVLMPSSIKQASLIVLFAVVVSMFVAIYALPFLWCLTITQVSDKIRVKKEKVVKTKQTVESAEGELENNYTENQVIEVKEDSGDESPSSDDNITIE
ncbi:MAG: hypothetical protein IJ458_04770 [Clostridia bacterium]|nr:hypothetical protein [Clostridia bacterium]